MSRRGVRGGTVLVMAACLLLAGCYEDTGVTLYDPGEYKGAPDPLRDTQLQDAQQARLQERFQQIQVDR